MITFINTKKQIASLNKFYFQKSKIFLYPLLEIKQGYNPVNLETYCNVYDSGSKQKNKLVVHYRLNEQNERCKDKNMTFEKYYLNVIESNKRFIKSEVKDNDNVQCFFDLKGMEEDVSLFKEGRYSRLSITTKSIIEGFYPKSHANRPYVESFLYPERYRSSYAYLLDVKESLLMEVRELCDKPNFLKETPPGSIIRTKQLDYGRSIDRKRV